MTLEMELNLSLNRSSTLSLIVLSLLDQVVKPQAFLKFLMVVFKSEVSSVKQVLPLEEVLSLQEAFKSINSVTS